MSTSASPPIIPADYLTYMSVVTWVVPFIVTFYAGVTVMYYFNSLGLQTMFKWSLLVSALLLTGILIYAFIYNKSKNVPLPTPVIMSLAGCIAGIIPVFFAYMSISGGQSKQNGGNNLGNTVNMNSRNVNNTKNNANNNKNMV